MGLRSFPQASLVNSSICGVRTALKFCALTTNQFESVPMLGTPELRTPWGCAPTPWKTMQDGIFSCTAWPQEEACDQEFAQQILLSAMVLASSGWSCQNSPGVWSRRYRILRTLALEGACWSIMPLTPFSKVPLVKCPW